MKATDLLITLLGAMPSTNKTEKLLIELVLHWIEARYELKEIK